MHASTFSIGAIVVTLSALSARVSAFHVESGTACSTAGAACSYISDDASAGGSNSTVVNGFCAPDLYCASNGAQCSSDAQCFNYCGSGTCGGQGAGCNSQETFVLGQTTITCNSGYTCSTNNAVGQCQPATATLTSTNVDSEEVPDSEESGPPISGASPLSRRRSRHRRFNDFDSRQARAADIRARSR